MSEMSEAYEQPRGESKKQRWVKQKWNTEVAMFLAGELEFKVEVIQEHHLRLFHPDKRRLDYFPQKGRSSWVGSNKWFVIPDIEQFILKHFK